MKQNDNAQLQASKMRQQLHLSDGRTIVFDEYGMEDGFPIVFMHGTSGSRLE